MDGWNIKCGEMTEKRVKDDEMKQWRKEVSRRKGGYDVKEIAK